MFRIVERAEGEWVLTWGGVEFPQTPLPTRELAAQRLTRMQNRWPGKTFELGLAAAERKPAKIGWRWTMPDGSTGVIVTGTKADAKSVLRYNLQRKALPAGTTWEPEYDA